MVFVWTRPGTRPDPRAQDQDQMAQNQDQDRMVRDHDQDRMVRDQDYQKTALTGLDIETAVLTTTLLPCSGLDQPNRVPCAIIFGAPQVLGALRNLWGHYFSLQNYLTTFLFVSQFSGPFQSFRGPYFSLPRYLMTFLFCLFPSFWGPYLLSRNLAAP